MSQFFYIHPDNPQQRLIEKAVQILSSGGVIVYPTDSAYALGCHIGDKAALDRIRAIRRLDEKHNLTLMCRDLSELGMYAKVDNAAYRLIKRLIPGPFTFVLQATKEVPRRLQHEKRKTIGLRVPDNAVALALLEALGEPIMTATLQMPGEEYPLQDPDDIRDRLEHDVDCIINVGYGGLDQTTVIDLTDGQAEIIRQGKGILD